MDWKKQWMVEFNPEQESFRVRRADHVFNDGRRTVFEGAGDKDRWVSIGMANSIEEAGEFVGMMANHLACTKELEQSKCSTAELPE